MPQDTLPNELNNIKYNIIPVNADSLNKAVLHLKTVLTKEQEFQKKSDAYSAWAPLYTFILLAGIWIVIRLKFGKNTGYTEIGTGAVNEEEVEMKKDYRSYEGNEINLSVESTRSILEKRFPYFRSLTPEEKDRFIYRIHKFIKQKTFKIHDDSGYNEMPVLISAAAIQLSFGLEKYLLPDFPYIHIFPEEFIGMHPSIRFLEGNVTGNSINISWKHFLKGFEFPSNGQNVGLHEMSHAYYCQNFESRQNTDHDFVSTFSKFNNYGNKVFEAEHKPGNDLYSEYAMKNFQEFWAESVEIFFEKPQVMRSAYPDLYAAISDLLNQDPAEKIPALN
jgi:hypothetical protein